MKKLSFAVVAVLGLSAAGIDHPGISGKDQRADRLTLIRGGKPLVEIVVADRENSAVKIAASNLAKDFGRVTGTDARVTAAPSGKRAVTVRVDPSDELAGMRETYRMTVGADGIEIVGSDRRGAVYGIYELSEQIGVSPWYDWADVPVPHRETWAITRGVYTNGEPKVRYRGIFLNDEAPCLTGWVKNTYGTNFGDHRFYARVGELILRLRGNFLWPAMWCWSFYADDPLNSKTMDDMGVIMGTSHHEPMARNHQEWVRKRKEYGVWNYSTNQDVLDLFFKEGIERCKNTEDLVTIGMRGDGDAAMGDQTDLDLMRRIITNQRDLIEKSTGKPAAETPQVWALYKEILDYYDAGLRPPEDVTLLLCDDNWGNVRRLPTAEERRHPGGWGMYYHVDYVGAPRNSKLLNCTTAAALWEQMSLAYEYGVDRLWILNVGDLKPMEYPIQLFLDMAWNPERFMAENLKEHLVAFCSPVVCGGRGAAALPKTDRRVAEILERTYRYAARVTPEMLDANTYDFASGEWKRVRDDYVQLADAARALEKEIPKVARNWYRQIVLFHVDLMANLYDMYYCQAVGDQKGADAAFAKDAELCRAYNEDLSDGKWNGFMKQHHIGYSSWNDNFKAEIRPIAIDRTKEPRVVSRAVVREATDYDAMSVDPSQRWIEIPGLGRTRSALEVFPRTVDPKDAKLVYKVKVPSEATTAKVTVNVRSSLAFARKDGHRYMINGREVNVNARLNEDKANIYSVFYPTVARRVVSTTLDLSLGARDAEGRVSIELCPLDPGIAFESLVVDVDGTYRSYLYGTYHPSYNKPVPPPAPVVEKVPYITSIQRSKSFDRDLGENWWMRRHNAILERIKTDKEYDLVLAGDSITHRWERHGKEAYVAVTNSLKVLNLGFGADCVRNLLWRFRSGELDGYHAKVVHLMIGTNNGDDPDETAAQIRACLAEIRKRQPQATILLCAILPRDEPDSVTRSRNEAVNALIRPLADGKKVIWQDWSALFLMSDGRLDTRLTDDRLHPNAMGYASWCKAALPVWKRLICADF